MPQQYRPPARRVPLARLPARPNRRTHFGRAPIPRMLAVVRTGRAADLDALRWALALSEEHGGRLSVLGLWRTSAWWQYVPMTGCVDIIRLLADERLHAEAWLHEALSSAPDRCPDLFVVRQSGPVARTAGSELGRRPYSHVVAARGTISERTARRWRARHRPLAVYRV